MYRRASCFWYYDIYIHLHLLLYLPLILRLQLLLGFIDPLEVIPHLGRLVPQELLHLLIVGAASLVAVLPHWRRKLLLGSFRLLLPFILPLVPPVASPRILGPTGVQRFPMRSSRLMPRSPFWIPPDFSLPGNVFNLNVLVSTVDDAKQLLQADAFACSISRRRSMLLGWLFLRLLLMLLLLGSLVEMAQVMFQTMHRIYQVGERCIGFCIWALELLDSLLGPNYCDEG